MTSHALLEVVLQAIIVDDAGRVLMLRRPSGKWQFAGGRMDTGESWQQALRREIWEETGITDFEIVNVMAVDNWIWEGVPEFGVYFYCRCHEQEIIISKEHDQYRWLYTEDNTVELQFFHPSLPILLERALRQETGFQILP
jgi:8-oxo-dGTP diphosphatase